MDNFIGEIEYELRQIIKHRSNVLLPLPPDELDMLAKHHTRKLARWLAALYMDGHVNA